MLRLLLATFKNAISMRIAYRLDFFLNILIITLFEFITPLFMIIIYRNGLFFPGWSLHEVFLIQGIFLIAKGLTAPMMFGMIWNIFELVREGTLDLLLIKPRPILILTSLNNLDLEECGPFFSGLMLTIYALVNLPAPGLINWLQCIGLFICSLIMLFACSLIMSGILFVWVANSRVHEIFEHIMMLGRYPLSIFSRPMQVVITAVIPVTVIGFFPAHALLDRSTPHVWFAVAATGVWLFLSILFWHRMLAKYTSAGG